MHHPPPFSGKRLRVMHTTNIASKMPRSFSMQSQGEARVLEYVQVWGGGGEEWGVGMTLLHPW